MLFCNNSIEENLIDPLDLRVTYLKCDANRRGAVTCQGNARTQDNRLEFTIDTDLPSIVLFMKDINKAIDKYPIKGKED